MGGRGSRVAADKAVAEGKPRVEDFKTEGEIDGIKVIKYTLGNNVKMPLMSYSSKGYVSYHPDGTFKELRLYDKKGRLFYELAYHRENSIKGFGSRVLHYHFYKRVFSVLPDGIKVNVREYRSTAKLATPKMIRRFEKLLKGIDLTPYMVEK